MRQFFESRGYRISINYNQYIYGYNNNTKGYTFEQYKQDINAGIPVLIHVSGHTMIGFGYDVNNIVYLHDTWDFETHSMMWGGDYEGLQHYGVSVIKLSSTPCNILPCSKNSCLPAGHCLHSCE